MTVSPTTERGATAVSKREKPTGSFGEHFEAAIAAAPAGPSQKVELFAKGASIGWLGEDSGQWCVVASGDAAVAIEPYVWKSILYYRNAADTSRYLSVSDGDHYVGFYNWNGATGWAKNGDVLTSLYSNAQLSFFSSQDGYVYANDGAGYTPLTVEFH